MSSTPATSKGLILLTGATGYIAAHIAVELIQRGYRVRGTVRSLKDSHRYEYLHQVCGDVDKTLLEFAEGDLESPLEVWDKLLVGCVGCVHTAGPVKLTVSNVQRELLDPMLTGVSTLFSAMERSATCKRIVYTSSASTLSDNFPQWKSKVYTGEDWNNTSSMVRNPYMFAKTQVERWIHDHIKSRGKDNSLAVACILPYQVIGPSLQPHPKNVNETMDLPIRGALDGEMYLVNFVFSFIDVRDMARVHVSALDSLNQPSLVVPRYICAQPPVSFKHLSKMLAEICPQRKSRLPKHYVPSAFVLMYLRLMMERGVYRYVKANLGHAVRMDCSNVKTELGVEFRALKDTLRDIVEWMEKEKLLKTLKH